MKERWDAPPGEEEQISETPLYQPGAPGCWPLPAGVMPDTDRPTWTFRDTLVGVLLTLIPWLALASLALLQPSAQPATDQPVAPGVDIVNAVLTLIVQVALEGTFLIAPLWFAVFKPRRQARQQDAPVPAWRAGLRALGLRAFRPGQALGAFALGVLAIYTASFLYAYIAETLHLPIQTNVDQLLDRAASAPWTTLATIVGAITIAPFCEEIFFRGYFFQGLRLRVSLWLAIILSAVVFGLAHGDLGSLPLLVVIGLALAIIRWRTRSLWPGMALHIFNNVWGAWVIFQAIHF